MAMNKQEERYDDGDQDNDDPRAQSEFRDCDDHENTRSQNGIRTVDDDAGLPVWSARLPPVHDHAGIRHGECKKDADGVQVNQAIDIAPKRDDQQARNRAERDDPGRKSQTIPTKQELVRHVVVARQDRRKPRKIGKRRVGRDDQDAGGRDLEDVVREGRPKDSHRDLRDDRFIARNQTHVRCQVRYT